jgi:prepilin-type N-terminal cleavage/methylation domain-containing protein
MKMRLRASQQAEKPIALPCQTDASPCRSCESAFSLMEVMVAMLLLGILLIASFGGLFSMDLCSRRLGDHTAAMAIVEAKVQDLRGINYNPPNFPFTASTNYITTTNSISLDKGGTIFKVPGTIVSEIRPVASGHLVTVTGTFFEPRGSLTASLQTVVNQFSGGKP